MPFFSGSAKPDEDEYDNLGIDWVVHYVFDDVGLHLPPPPSPRITSDEAETDFFCYILARIHPGYQRIPNPHQ